MHVGKFRIFYFDLIKNLSFSITTTVMSYSGMRLVISQVIWNYKKKMILCAKWFEIIPAMCFVEVPSNEVTADFSTGWECIYLLKQWLSTDIIIISIDQITRESLPWEGKKNNIFFDWLYQLELTRSDTMNSVLKRRQTNASSLLPKSGLDWHTYRLQRDKVLQFSLSFHFRQWIFSGQTSMILNTKDYHYWLSID